MATYTWDAIYDRLKVDQGGLPNKSTQDMLDTFWTLAGYPDGTLGADAKVAFYESQGAIGDSLGDLEYDYWYRIGPNILAAKGAVFAIDAAQSISGEQWALNRGSGGQMLRAKYGSVARAEIRNGVGLVLPGASGNYAEVPDSPALSVSGDLDLIVCAAVDRWATGSVQGLISKVGSIPATANLSYALYLTAAGELQFQATDGVATTDNRTSSVNLASTTPGSVLWMRVLYNTVATRFYTSTDGITWAQLGSSQPARTVTIVDTAESVRFGQFGVVGSPLPMAGRIISAQIWSGNSTLGGSRALDIDFTAQADLTSSFVASTGQTVTVTAANAVDTNDPLWLPWNGENYMYTPGTVNNLAASSSSAETYGTGFQIRMRLQASTWSGTYNICGHALGATPASRNVFMLISAGYLVVGISDGAGSYWSTCPTIPAGVLPTDRPIWVSATGVLNAGTITTMYEWAEDSPQEPTSWTSLGSAPTAFPGAIQGASFPFNFGSAYQNGTGSDFVGRTYRGIFRNGAGSTLIDADFTRNTGHSSFVCATGQTITFDRSATGRKLAVVTRPIWLFGTDDYLEVADNDLLDFAASDEFSLVVVARLHGAPSAPAMIAKKASYAAADVGYSASINGGLAPRFTLADGTTRAEADGGAVITSGSVFVASTVASSTQVTTRMNASAGSTLSKPAGTLANSLPLRIGTMSTSTASPVDGEILAVGIFRRALSATEIAQIVTYYGAS